MRARDAEMSVRQSGARRGYVTLGEIAERLPMLWVQCDRCGRAAKYRTDKLVAKYGADASIEPFQNDITRDCPKRQDPNIELGNGCAPLCPDLSKLAMEPSKG